MIITEIRPGLYRVDQDGIFHLGIGIGPARSKLASNAMTSHQQTGTLFDSAGNIKSAWPIEGIISHHETLIAFGPWLDGAVPASAIVDFEKDRALQILASMAQAFIVLQQGNKLSTRGIFLDSSYFFPDGTLLVLPVFAQEAMLALRSLAEKTLSHEFLRLPAVDAADSHAFGLAILAFRVVCGIFPFEINQDWHDTKALIAHGVCQTPHCLYPQLDAQIEAVYQRFLVLHKFGNASLSEIGSIIELWRANSQLIETTNPNHPAVKAYQRRLTRQKQRRFLQLYGLRIAFISLIAILVLSVPLSILSNALRPLKTIGMEPVQVIQAFYSGFDNLDVGLMADATTDGAGKPAIDLVTNIFVIDRIRYANERKKVHYTPPEWRQFKDSVNSNSVMVFGIDNLKMQDMAAPNPLNQRNFLVNYQIWTNLGGDNQSDPGKPERDRAIRIEEHSDQIQLQKRTDGVWQIKEIKEIKTARTE